MASTDCKALHFILTYIHLIVITSVSSSSTCDANVLYEFIYCVSSDSHCAQCIPCYNDASLYIPNGETYARDCLNSPCKQCIETCAINFKNQTYIESNNILSTFISKIDISKLSIPNIYSFNCNDSSHYRISIKYAFIAPSNSVTNINTELCTLDISELIKSECNAQKTCNFTIQNSSLLNCPTRTDLNAYIGSYCISTQSTYNNDLCLESTSHNHIEKLHVIYLTIIIILATVLFLIMLIIILCKIKHFMRLVENDEMQKDKLKSHSTMDERATTIVRVSRNNNNSNNNNNNNNKKISSSIQMSKHLEKLRNRTLNTSVTLIETPIPDSPSVPITINHESDTIRSMILTPDGQYSTILPLPLTKNNKNLNKNNISMDYNNLNAENNENLAYMLMNPTDFNNNTKINKVQCIPHTEYQLEFEIGRGTTSKVYKVRWINKEMAAKRFFNTFDIDSKKASQYIDKYAQKILDLPHENVIKIKAFANEPFTILTEYINYGSVKKYVESKRVSIIDRIHIVLQAAKGIEHLHKLNIIHSEIMCNNLLMEFKNGINTRNINDIRVVITDYALQQMLTDDGLDIYRSSLGPLKWMAPELIENHNNNTSFHSDIYAFGITTWEIIAGKEPYQDTKAVDAAIHVLIKERRPQQYAFFPEEIQSLMKKCWQTDQNKRPNAKYVVQELQKYIQSH